MHVMDDAGEDAKAVKETAGGQQSPPGTISAMRQLNAQLMQDNRLLTTSVWCGLVFSVALVLTAINLMPPTPVGYRVSTKVFASPQRFEVLRRQLLTHTVGDLSNLPSDAPRLIGLHVLNGQPQAALAQIKAQDEPLALIEVRSLWPARTSSEHVHEWLHQLSEPDRRTLGKVDSARAERFARWEVQTAEHYLKHFRHTRHQDAAAHDGEEATLASSGDGAPTRFASLTTAPAGAGQPQTATVAADVEARLVHEFQQAAAREKSAAATVEAQALKLCGILTLAESPQVRAQPGRVPSALVVSVLVLALAGGAIGGWAHHRAQSGGIFYASEVARNMDGLGLPTLGVIHIAGAGLQAAAGKMQRRVTSFRRWAIKQSLALTELVVLFWCMAILIRLVLDPLWRAMLWDNPLAALGRLFIGLP